MPIEIADCLSAPMIGAIREALESADVWTDGAATAEGRARAVKRNEQAFGGPAGGVIETIKAALLANRMFASAVQPDAFARVMINRYRTGMEYGAHVDAAYVEGVRTDVSFTLFLSEPDEYEGGELIIDSAGAEDVVKLAAGAIVLYPATCIHRVTRVTRGERLACVGWVKSRVRSSDDRAMIFDLERALADLEAYGAPADLRDRLANLRNNLLRRAGD